MSFLDNTASDGFNITPNDNADLPFLAVAVYIGSAGNVSAVTYRGTTLTFNNVQPGTVLPFKIRRVLSTGTTAGGLIGATIRGAE